MTEFFQTQMGHRYYEYQLPELTKQLKRIADSLENGNYVKIGETVTHRGTEKHPDRPQETRERITKLMDDLQEKGSGTFRKPNANELLLLRQREAVRMGLEFNSDEVRETIDSAKIIVIDYVPDSPGWFGPLIFISWGASYEYYEVLRVTGLNRLESVKQSEDLEPEESKEPPDPDVGHFDYLKETDQLKSFDIKETPKKEPLFKKDDLVIYDGSFDIVEEYIEGNSWIELKEFGTKQISRLIRKATEKEAAEFIASKVPGATIVKRYPPLKITRYTEEQADKIDEISADFFAGAMNSGPVVAILALEIPESGGVVYITEHNNGNFWTEAGGDDITGTLEECIEHLKCEFP